MQADSSREIRTEVDEEQPTNTNHADSSRQTRQVQSTEITTNTELELEVIGSAGAQTTVQTADNALEQNETDTDSDSRQTADSNISRRRTDECKQTKLSQQYLGN
ncbi:hypothetical protein Tco_1058205 [Tanacetum coccineum]|uniref:Uncharacterized protein n=1 Tax=Tanacetum coccineum TaxID=301880 RepID=A0ABQ5H823_9ASTR